MKCSGKEWDSCRIEKMGCTGCHYSESKEMFEELGYTEETRFMDKSIVEALFVRKINNAETTAVYFYKDKTIYVPSSFESNILPAINKKCKELGWI